MSKKTPEEDRAEQVRTLLGSPLMESARDTMEGFYFDQWRKTAPSEAEARERIHAELRGWRQFYDFFEAVMVQGDQARAVREESERILRDQSEAQRRAQNPDEEAPAGIEDGRV